MFLDLYQVDDEKENYSTKLIMKFSKFEGLLKIEVSDMPDFIFCFFEITPMKVYIKNLTYITK